MPNRPDHPDFWLISQTLIDNDASLDIAVDKPAAFRTIVNAVADIASLQYAAEQRALRAFGANSPSGLRTAAAALWMDGFVAGAGYHKLKTEGGQSAPEGMEET